MQSGAVFLYNLFSPSPEWCRAHGEAIKKTLGPYPASVAPKACNNVKKIVQFLPARESSDSTEEKSKSSENDVLSKEFGHNIAFKFEPNLLDDSQPSSIDDDSFSDEEDERGADQLSSSLLAELTSTEEHKNVTTKTKHSHITEGEGKYGGKWLEDQCKNCELSGLSWKQLYAKIFDLLSTASDDVLQNDVSSVLTNNYCLFSLLQLVELLGFSHLELIQELLMNKATVVDRILSDGSNTSSALISSGTVVSHSCSLDSFSSYSSSSTCC